MPDLSGLEATAAIRKGVFPGARVIILTAYDGDVYVRRAVQCGAQGYLLKTAGPDAGAHGDTRRPCGRRHATEGMGERLAENLRRPR